MSVFGKLPEIKENELHKERVCVPLQREVIWPRILHLTLKKKWFDLIARGEKKEEYREVKPYWLKRLQPGQHFKEYDVIKFRNGYNKNCPEMVVEFKGIRYGKYNNKLHFIISLGKILEIRNWKDI